MDEEPQDDGARLTELADFWLYEHLLSLPKSIATDEIINHLGSKYPFRHGEGASLPAPISARLFLRHLREPPQLPVTDWEEQLQLLGLMCQLSCKHEQFQSRQAAAAMHPPSELMVEVLMQLLCTRADPAFSAEPDEQGEQQQPLTSAAVASVAEELLSNADVEYLQDDEQLQNRLSLLEQLLRGRLEARKLQKHLREAFPAAAVEEHLREYADKAWAALGDTSLQRYQAEVLSGSLPFDPMQHFAVLAPVATQAAFEDVAVLDDAEASQQQRQQRTRASRPVPLLGEATAPALGAEELEPPGSSQGRRAGRGSRLQQAATGASPQPKASPMPRASPQQARSSPAAAVAAAGAEDAGKPGRRPRAPTNKAAQEAAPAVHPTRKQLQLLPSNAAAAAAAGADRPEAEAGRKGRKSRRQQQEETEIIESEPPAATADMAAAAAGSGGRRRGRKASPAAAAAAPAGGAGDAEEQQVMDGLELLAAAGAAQEGGAGGPGGKKGLGSAFQSFLNKPLDSLAAAAGGLAAVVRGSPASGGVSGGPKERKMCGAPTQGVQGRTVPWESPFGGSIDSPEEASPRGKSGKSAAAAAAAGDPSRAAADARKRKRSHQAAGGQQKGPLAAARAVGAARAPDSGNTEYQDAREEAGQSEESKELPAAAAAAASRQRGQGQGHGQSPRQRLHKQQQQRQLPQRVRGGAAAAAAAAAAGGGDDSSVDDPESDDAFDYDGGSDDEGNAGGQQQRRRQGRPSSKQPQQHKRPAGAASGGRARGGGAAFDPDFDEAGDVHGGHKKRRKVRRWTAEEEALLIQLVAQEGEGQWALIHQLGGDGFDSRTQVDLKDKWRNLKKRGAGSD